MKQSRSRIALPVVAIWLIWLSATPSVAEPGLLTLVSTTATGVKGDNHSFAGSLSADGTKIAFTSFARNFDPRDTDTGADIYVKDLVTGALTLASTSDTGVKGNLGSDGVSLSADGTKVAFRSYATNFDPADTDAFADVYVKDLTTGELTLASISGSGVKGNGRIFMSSEALSADGTHVGFSSEATNLDPADIDPAEDVYVKDLTTGELTLVSTSDTGIKGNGVSTGAALSADGTRVGFDSGSTNFDPIDNKMGNDVYVKDLTTGDITLVSTSDTGAKGNGPSTDFSLSADGLKVALKSCVTNFDPADTDGFCSTYVKDLSTGDITLASITASGVNANRNTFAVSLSGDGTRVAFDSFASNLDPADTESAYDVYVKDLVTGELILASISNTGVGSNGQTLTPDLAADGSKVAFTAELTTTNLDPSDTDAVNDVYVKDLGASNEPCTLAGTDGADTLKGTPGADVICGLGGADQIKGLGGDDTVLGGPGNDVLVGGAGADVLQGEDGDDVLRTLDGISGNDSADGGPGSDKCKVDAGDTVISCP
jgi:Tol biopolymer transport system component